MFSYGASSRVVLSPAFLQLHNPTERKTDESQEDPDGSKLWIPQSLVRVTRKGNICSLVTTLPRKGNYCLKKAVDQLSLPQVNSNYTGVETVEPTLWPASTAKTSEGTQILRTREIFSWKRQWNYMSRMLPEHLVLGNQVQRLWVREKHYGQVWMKTLKRIMTSKQGVRFLILYLAKVYLIKMVLYSCRVFQLCDSVANGQIEPIQFKTILRLLNDLHNDS